MEKREWKLLFIGILIDIFSAGLLSYLQFSIDSILILIMLVNVLLVTLRILYEIIRPEEAKILTGSKDVLKLAEDYIHDAKKGDTITAMWTTMKFDKVLREYFTKTLRETTSKGIITQRLIDINYVPLDAIITHIMDTREYLEEGLYKIVFVPKGPRFEMLLVGTRRGIIFNSYKEGTLASACKDEKIINALHNFFTLYILSGKTEEFDPNMLSEYTRENIKKYLEDIKDRLEVKK